MSITDTSLFTDAEIYTRNNAKGIENGTRLAMFYSSFLSAL